MTSIDEERDLIAALRASHYPGASDASVHMVIAYCRAMRVDPMLKPVHIVPMPVKDKETGREVWRDVVMPGIGLYRIIADRSGVYLGIEPPVVGPTTTATIAGESVTFPEWVEVTVKKAVGKRIAEFPAREYWIENYGTRSGGAVNAMWKRRPLGQLAKCAEAQALRRAFPDLIPAGPTADERVISADGDDLPTVGALPAPDAQAAALSEQLRARGAKQAAAQAAAQAEPVPMQAAPHDVSAAKSAEPSPALDEMRASVAALKSVEGANDLLDVLRHANLTDDQRAQVRREIHEKMRAITTGADKP